MRRIVVVTLAIILLFSMSSILPVNAERTEECGPLGGVDICIQDMDASDRSIEEGETTEVIVELENIGDTTGTARVILGVQRESQQMYHHVGSKEVSAGDSVILTEPLRAETPGLPQINVLVMNTDESHLYDATGYDTTITVSESSRDWQGSLTTTHLVVGIIASLLSIAVLWKRLTN